MPWLCRSSSANPLQAYGIGIAWGADLEPKETAEIVLCSPDTIPVDQDLIVRRQPRSPAALVLT
jgi:hypothetical protein